MAESDSGDTGQFMLNVVKGYQQLSELAAAAVQATLDSQRGAAITVPTGQTPLGMYEELVRRSLSGTLDLGQAQIFCLDDYLGKAPDDEVSLTHWLYRVFLTPALVPQDNIHRLPTTADDPEAAATQYEADIEQQGGLALAVIGLGSNGHVAFNEPGSQPDSRTRVVTLTRESRDQSAEYWGGGVDVPTHAMTMGLGTILSARRIVLIAAGESKAAVVKRALKEKPTTDVPASWLQRAGSRLEVILDQDAAAQIV